MAWITAAVTGVQRGKDSVTYGLKGDWAGSLVNGLALGGKVAEALFKRQASEAFKKATEAAAKKAGLPTPTYIIDAMMLAINLVALLNGFGDERGSSISTAKEQLENVKLSLEAAIPDSRDWSGDSADAYVNLVNKLQEFVQTMETVDAELKGYVVNQADSVKQANMAISYSTLALIAAYIPALALYAVPIIGAELSMAFQIVAAFAVGAAVFAMEMMTLANSMSISNQLQATITKYDTLGTNVVNDMSGDFGSIDATLRSLQGKTAEKVTVGSFTAISDGLSEFAAAPSIASLAAAAGDNVAPTQRALISALSEPSSATEGAPMVAAAREATAAAPAADAPAAVATPTFAPPSLAQMAQVSGQLSTISQPINQGVQQIQQLVQQGQQAAATRAVETSAEQPATEEAPAEVGAASGTPGSERAPVDTPRAGAEPTAAGRERVL